MKTPFKWYGMELISRFFHYRIAHLNAAWLENDFSAICKITSEDRAISTLPRTRERE